MPIGPHTTLNAIPRILAANVAAYNAPVATTAAYNVLYGWYISARTSGFAAAGSLSAWIAAGGAAPAISALLHAFGMNSRASRLVAIPTLHATLVALPGATINWIAGIGIPLAAAPSALSRGAGSPTLAAELTTIYNHLATPGAISVSGGYVAASKTLHCLFPELALMIDGRHSGVSYFNIDRTTYTPPVAGGWAAWIGAPLRGPPNPSPRGGGQRLWGSQQFLAAVGINQHIYTLWQAAHGHPGLPAFLALDPTPGTTGIPRVIDKVLW